MDTTKMIPVQNRNNGTTGYLLPESGIYRSWAPNEEKMISLDELKKAQWVPGVDYILKNLLIIKDAEALQELNMAIEPEYMYTEKDIRELLLFGSYDEMEDFLNFAPAGCLEVAKDIAVKEEIPDSRKREMISKKTGFNIDSAIMVNRIMADGEEKVEDEKPVRKVAPKTTEATPARKTTPKYNVVSTAKK